MLIPTIVLITIGFIVIFTILAFQIWWYKKNKISVFETKKIVIIGIFLAFYIIQSFITRIQNYDNVLLVSFDSSSIILISFLFGPIEGFIYSILADNLRVLIVGQWAWQLLYAMIFPMISLISGTLGQIYLKRETKLNSSKYESYFEKNPFINFFIVQISFFVILIISLTVGYLNPTNLSNGGIVFKTITYFTLVVIVIYEAIYFYFLKTKKYKSLDLLLYILIIAIIYRYVIMIFYSSVADVNYWAPSFGSVFIPRLFKSSYQVPLMIIIWHFLISIVKEEFINPRQNNW